MAWTEMFAWSYLFLCSIADMFSVLATKFRGRSIGMTGHGMTYKTVKEKTSDW